MPALYFDYFSVSTTIASTFTLLTTVFLLTIPKKSKATLMLGLIRRVAASERKGLLCPGAGHVSKARSEDTDGRNVNSDESAFLQRVEEGQGGLEGIVESLLSGGLLTDDLSLMRISFKEDAPARLAFRRGEIQKMDAEDRVAAQILERVIHAVQ